MSWAEFQMRCYGYWRERENQARLFREVAYQSYQLQFILSKKKPKAKSKFWPIGKEVAEKQAGVPKSHIDALLAQEKIDQQKNGNS